MTRHEAPEATDRYLCPEHISAEGIVSASAAAWFNKTLNSEPRAPRRDRKTPESEGAGGGGGGHSYRAEDEHK